MGPPCRAVALVLVSALASTCGGGSRLPAPTGDELQDRGAVPGGTVTVGVWSEPESFLQAGITGSLSFAYLVDAPVAEGLLWYRDVASVARARSPADYWQPWLATEVPTPENGDVRTSGCPAARARMCVIWKLRGGVRWHDGSGFTSRDVCDTYALFYTRYGARNPTALADTSGWDQVLDCVQLGPLIAVVDFRSRYGPYLTLGSGVYGILPSTFTSRALATNQDLTAVSETVDLSRGSGNRAAFHGTATLDTVMDGTGPFVFAFRDGGRSIELVRNRHYWNAAHQPHVDRIVFRVLPGIASEVDAAVSGRIDMGVDMRLESLPALDAAATRRRLAIDMVPASGAEALHFNLCARDGALCGTGSFNPVTADPAVRRAILLALDRPAIAQRAGAGATVPRDSALALGASYASDAAIPATRQDVVAARRELDRAGYRLDPRCDGGRERAAPDGTCVSVNLGTVSTSSVRVAAEAMVRDELETVGIHVNQPFTPNLDPDRFFAGFAQGGPLYTHGFDIAMFATTLSRPGEPDSLYPRFHGDCGGRCPRRNQIPSDRNGGVGGDVTGENDAALDRLLDEGRTTADPVARAGEYRQAGRRLALDLPEIPLYRYAIVNSHPPALHGLRLNDMVWDYNSYDWYCDHGTCQSPGTPG